MLLGIVQDGPWMHKATMLLLYLISQLRCFATLHCNGVQDNTCITQQVVRFHDSDNDSISLPTVCLIGFLGGGQGVFRHAQLYLVAISQLGGAHRVRRRWSAWNFDTASWAFLQLDCTDVQMYRCTSIR